MSVQTLHPRGDQQRSRLGLEGEDPLPISKKVNVSAQHQQTFLSKSAKNSLKHCGKSMLMTVIAITLNVGHAFLFALMWKWFFTPYGAPVLNIDAAVGVACILTLVKAFFFGEQFYTLTGIGMSIARLCLIFGIAYAAHGHMFSGMSPFH